MRAWNIFICGSAHNRNDEHNLITTLWKNIPEGDSKNFILAGAGSWGTFMNAHPMSRQVRDLTVREKLEDLRLTELQAVPFPIDLEEVEVVKRLGVVKKNVQDVFKSSKLAMQKLVGKSPQPVRDWSDIAELGWWNPGDSPKDEPKQPTKALWWPKKWRSATGTLIGNEAMAIIADDIVDAYEWMPTRYRPDRVNLIGWSRGAVSALMAAQQLTELQELTPEVSLFLIDPVPGPTYKLARKLKERWYDSKAIPENVVESIQIVMLNVETKIYRYQLGRGCDKQHHVVPLPGIHSTPVYQCEESNWGEVFTVTKALASQFLHAHSGTRQDAYKGAKRMCESYATMLLKHPDLIKRDTGGWSNVRSYHDLKRQYWGLARYYINRHHRDEMLRWDPRLVRFVDRTEALSTLSPQDEIRRVIGELKFANSMPPVVRESVALYLRRLVPLNLAEAVLRSREEWQRYLALRELVVELERQGAIPKHPSRPLPTRPPGRWPVPKRTLPIPGG